MDLQNWLGFVVAPWRGNQPNDRTAPLSSIFASGKRYSNGAASPGRGVFSRSSFTETEERCLRANRSEPAARWDVLHLTAEHLPGME
jgi:hypothetical protein